VVRNEHRLGRATIEKVAQQLAASFPTDRIALQLREALPDMPQFAELREKVLSARTQAAALLDELHLPNVPSVDELKQRARVMYANSPSLDEIAERARHLILDSVALHLFAEPDRAVG
jgi:stearoyl-CoA desaturase (delta-9 desaturase)